MSATIANTSPIRPEDIDNLTKTETTPGGLKLDIVLSPAVKSMPRPTSQPSSPITSEIIEERLTAAQTRKEMLEQLRVKNISEKLSKLDQAKEKREEKSTKVKEELESKLEAVEKKRLAQVQQTREKAEEHLAKVEKAQRDLEIQQEAARVSTGCALAAKLNKAQEKRVEQVEEVIIKIKLHDEHVAEVRQSKEKHSTSLEAKRRQVDEKLMRAAKERERQEQELRTKLEERNRKAEIVRQNKTKLAEEAEANVGPESA